MKTLTTLSTIIVFILCVSVKGYTQNQNNLIDLRFANTTVDCNANKLVSEIQVSNPNGTDIYLGSLVGRFTYNTKALSNPTIKEQTLTGNLNFLEQKDVVSFAYSITFPLHNIPSNQNWVTVGKVEFDITDFSQPIELVWNQDYPSFPPTTLSEVKNNQQDILTLNSTGNVFDQASSFCALAPLATFTNTGNDFDVDFTNNTEIFNVANTAFTWNFGEGNTSNLKNPTHSFEAIGLYNVCLTASNINGSNVYCKDVEVKSTSTGINNVVKIDNPFNVYPNPAVEYFVINVENNSTIEQVSIYSSTGQLVKTLNTLNNNTVNVTDLAVGSYNIEVIIDGVKYTERFTRNR